MAARPTVPMVADAVAFFASGAAALVYQVAWQRIPALETGVGIYSIALEDGVDVRARTCNRPLAV
jgi:hypothetical protein